MVTVKLISIQKNVYLLTITLGLVLIFSIAVTTIPAETTEKGKDLSWPRVSVCRDGEGSEVKQLSWWQLEWVGESSRVTLDQEAEVKGNLGLGLAAPGRLHSQGFQNPCFPKQYH